MGIMNAEFTVMVISEKWGREYDWRRYRDFFTLLHIFIFMLKIFHDRKEQFREEEGNFYLEKEKKQKQLKKKHIKLSIYRIWEVMIFQVMKLFGLLLN